MSDQTEYNPFTTQGAMLLTAWTLNLACDPMFRVVLMLDAHMFATFYAAASSAVAPPEALRASDEEGERQIGEGERVLTILKDVQRQFGTQVGSVFAMAYMQGLAVHSKLNLDAFQMEGTDTSDAFEQWREDATQQASQKVSSTETNADRIAKLLSLSTLERDLLVMQLYRDQPGFSQVMNALMQTQDSVPMMLGAMLGEDYNQVRAALDPEALLSRSGLLRVYQRPLRVSPPSEALRSVLAEPADTDEVFVRRFVRPLKPDAATASVARLDDRDADILVSMLRLPMPDEHGLHALVYGSPSIDKRDLVARTLQDAQIEVYEVRSKDVPASDLPAWVHIAQQHVSQTAPDAVLVIDRAENALTARRQSLMSLFGMMDMDDDGSDDQESDEGLTETKARCIWMTGAARWLSERNLGRFLFQCEARPGSRADRRKRVQEVISQFELSTELEQHLSEYNLIGEQTVRQAARLAELLVGDAGDEHHEHVIRRAVFQSQRALGRESTEGLRKSVTTYSLDNLNLTGKFKPEQIIKSLTKRPRGAICLYGLPGSGKTQLAEYMALQLDMPILMRRASELLDMYVGNNEKNIAAMFAEAEAEGAILFLDEADSFMRDRSMARAEWNVTMVNEMLQAIERFPGIFIAATNLMDDVDAAALRRFTFKLEFLPLQIEQSWQMLVTEAQLDPEREDAIELRERLAAIPNLTPGDFAVIKRQIDILDEQMNVEEWLVQLAEEAKMKMHGLKRNKLGFGVE